MNSLVQEDKFEEGMELAQKNAWVDLKRILDNTDPVTAEAIRESLSAEDFNQLMRI